jgi:hypothetical protein
VVPNLAKLQKIASILLQCLVKKFIVEINQNKRNKFKHYNLLDPQFGKASKNSIYFIAMFSEEVHCGNQPKQKK